MHGYLSSGKSFSKQLPFFARDFEVFAPDLKGFGENAGMDYPYKLDDYVAETKEYMYKNSLRRPHVIAHSFGCRITLKAAAFEPTLFDKLVLCGAAGLKPRNTLKKTLKKAAFGVLKTFVKKEKLSRFYSPDYLALSGVMKQSFKYIVGETLDYTLPLIKNPTLLAFGENDAETPLYMAERLREGISDSELLVLKEAGHFCFIDRPLKFNAEVKEFLLS